ncbi:MAG TPA: aldo/keto reductase, partial [archaeon]|nr:aldo/keto reductase [archaeon]
VLGMGGGSALSMVKEDDLAVALIDFARRKGVNYFDTGSEYGGGKSEQRFGEALSGYRKEIYLSTKYGVGEAPDELKKKVETSLSRFRTDYIDVANMHGLTGVEDVEKMFSSGAMETLVKLKEEGTVKYIGFTSHSSPAASIEALKRFDFDTCLMAANASKVPYVGEFEGIADASFEDEAIPLGLEKGVGVWAFKITGQRRLIARNNEPDKAPGLELIRYALSLPVHGVILGMNMPEHVETAAALTADFTPMTKEEMRQWNERLAPSANELTLDYLRADYVDDGGYRAHLA